jgi:hypothetical protein
MSKWSLLITVGSLAYLFGISSADVGNTHPGYVVSGWLPYEMVFVLGVFILLGYYIRYEEEQ